MTGTDSDSGRGSGTHSGSGSGTATRTGTGTGPGARTGGDVRIGPPDKRRQMIVKLLWVGIWMVYLSAPVDDLRSGRHAMWATALGWTGLDLFIAIYLMLVFRHTTHPLPRYWMPVALTLLSGLAVGLPMAFGQDWLVLFVFASVGFAAAAPGRGARWAVPIATCTLVVLGELVGGTNDAVFSLVVPCLLGGFTMAGVRQLLLTTRELRDARATVAHLAANEERLRLARDLHDLLGHSLSLITLKSELAGRMLPDQPGEAAQQIADIERVSRQALVDVREAVSGYRRPTLPVELAGARTALTAAGIAADLAQPPAGGTYPRLSAECEGVLAWAVREAVTNVVRHSGASRCAVVLTERQTLDGPVLELSVEDDGKGGDGKGGDAERGNGLRGLAERLDAVSGALETGPGRRRGFALLARVPLGPAQEASGDPNAWPRPSAGRRPGETTTSGRQRPVVADAVPPAHPTPRAEPPRAEPPRAEPPRAPGHGIGFTP